MNELFEHTSIKKAYFTLAMPVVLSMAVTLVYNLVDTFFISKPATRTWSPASHRPRRFSPS